MPDVRRQGQGEALCGSRCLTLSHDDRTNVIRRGEQTLIAKGGRRAGMRVTRGPKQSRFLCCRDCISPLTVWRRVLIDPHVCLRCDSTRCSVAGHLRGKKSATSLCTKWKVALALCAKNSARPTNSPHHI